LLVYLKQDIYEKPAIKEKLIFWTAIYLHTIRFITTMDYFNTDPLSNQNTAAAMYKSVVSDAKRCYADLPDTKASCAVPSQPSNVPNMSFTMMGHTFNLIKNGDYTTKNLYYTQDYYSCIAWCTAEELTEYNIVRIIGNLKKALTKVTGIVLVHRVECVPSYSIDEYDEQNVLKKCRTPTQYCISNVRWLNLDNRFVPTIVLYTDKDCIEHDERYFCLQFISALKDAAPREELIKMGQQFDSYSNILKKKADKTREVALDAVKQIVTLGKFIEEPDLGEIDTHIEQKYPKKRARTEKTRVNLRPDNLACSPCYVQEHEFPAPVQQSWRESYMSYLSTKTPSYTAPDIKQGEREVKNRDATLPASLIAAYSDMKYSDIWKERYRYGAAVSTAVTDQKDKEESTRACVVPLKEIYSLIVNIVPVHKIHILLACIRLFINMPWDSIAKVASPDSKAFDIVAYKHKARYTLEFAKFLRKETDDLTINLNIDGQSSNAVLSRDILSKYKEMWKALPAESTVEEKDVMLEIDNQNTAVAIDTEIIDIKEQIKVSREPVKDLVTYLGKKCAFVSALRLLLEAPWESVYVDPQYNIVACIGHLCVTINSSTVIDGRSGNNLSMRVDNNGIDEFQMISYGSVRNIMDIIKRQLSKEEDHKILPQLTDAPLNDCKYPLVWKFIVQLQIPAEEFIYVEQILDLCWENIELEEMNVVFYSDVNMKFGHLNTAEVIKDTTARLLFVVYNKGRIMTDTNYAVTAYTVNLIKRSLLCETTQSGTTTMVQDQCSTLDDVQRRLSQAFYTGTGAVEQVMRRIDRLLNEYLWINWKILPNGSVMLKNPNGTFLLCVARLGTQQSTGISELVLEFVDRGNVRQSESFFDNIFEKYATHLVWNDKQISLD
jgi:hypothetical protein